MADAPDTMRDEMDGVEPHGDTASALPTRTLTDADAQAIAKALLEAARLMLGNALTKLGARLTGETNGT